jgi:hypothetical protein
MRRAGNYSLFSARETTIRRDLLPIVQKALGARYTLRREIGRGGAARVFLAEDPSGTKVALRCCTPSFR